MTLDVSTNRGKIEVLAGEAGRVVVTGTVTVRRIASSLRVRTQSGAVNAALAGQGDVDVATGSSAIRLSGVRGGATVVTQSGRVTIDGSPTREWALTGSLA